MSTTTTETSAPATERHPSRRVLLGCFGSAGDLFPLVAIAEELRARGHEVRFAVPRSLGAYLRVIGEVGHAIGDGSEVGVLRDDAIVTTGDDGWSSWERTFDHYLAPGLPGAVDDAHRALERWVPDVVATTTFATAVRAAALSLGLPHVALSIYPSLSALAGEESSGFAPRYQAAVGALGGGARAGSDLLRWGLDRDAVLLHDPSMLEPGDGAAGSAVGYPYWDALPHDPGAVREARDWLGSAGGPGVIVTLGSFLGLGRARRVEAVVAEVGAEAARVLVVNADRATADAFGGDPRVLTCGFVPLSAVAPSAAAVVHHGGLGTSMAVAYAGIPAVVAPQAFDQPRNARVLARLGVAVDASRTGVGGAIVDVLGEPVAGVMARAATRFRCELVAPARPAADAGARILERSVGVVPR